MITLDNIVYLIGPGILQCFLTVDIMGSVSQVQVDLNQSDVIAFNNGVIAWTEQTVQAYLESQNVTVILPTS